MKYEGQREEIFRKKIGQSSSIFRYSYQWLCVLFVIKCSTMITKKETFFQPYILNFLHIRIEATFLFFITKEIHYTRNSPNSCNSNNSWHFPLLSATLVSKLVIIRCKLGRCSWFATTCQGGQDGDQYTDIFLKEFSSSEHTTIYIEKG